MAAETEHAGDDGRDVIGYVLAMLILVASFAFAADPAPPAAPEEGPGRPVVGIGTGLRGGESGAGFIASVRLRATPRFVLEPMVYVESDTTDASETATAEGEVLSEEVTRTTELLTYATLSARFAVVESRRASGWFTVNGSVLVQDLAKDYEYTVTGDDPIEQTATYDAFSVAAGAGFGGELWLRPELTLSADAGFILFETSRVVQTLDDVEQIEASTGFRLDPYAQLAIHLYL